MHKRRLSPCPAQRYHRSPAHRRDRQEKASLPIHPQPPRLSAMRFYVVVAAVSCSFLATIGVVGFAILRMDSGRLHMTVKVKDLLEMQTEVDKRHPFPTDTAR